MENEKSQIPNPKSQIVKVHATAIIEENVKIGDGTSVWDNVHIRHGATIGEECIVGEKTYIAYDVSIGNRVKINAEVLFRLICQKCHKISPSSVLVFSV